MGLREEPRFYRKIFHGEDLVYFTVKVKQTDLCIGAVQNLKKYSSDSIIKYRQQIEEYIRLQPDFLHSLEPVTPLKGAPPIVNHMCGACEVAGVGPMAAIAGAISMYVANDLAKYSSELVVENGGDIYITGNMERTVGVYAGRSELTGKIGLKIPADQLPISICTSSGTVGHSLSFGRADAVVIMSKDACLADAAATAVGNIVKNQDDIERGLNKAQTIPGVKGALIIVEKQMGAWGNVKLVKL